LPKAILKLHRYAIACPTSVHGNVNERLNIVQDAKESECDLSFDIRENAQNPSAESNVSFWLIAVCMCKYQEALSGALLDIFAKVSRGDQIGGLCLSTHGLLVPDVLYSTTDVGFP
jgi:hypothetical protein